MALIEDSLPLTVESYVRERVAVELAAVRAEERASTIEECAKIVETAYIGRPLVEGGDRNIVYRDEAVAAIRRSAKDPTGGKP
jgi:hypothetical protein